MKTTIVEHVSEKAKKALRDLDVKFELGYNDVYRFNFIGVSTIQVNESFEFEGVKFAVKNGTLSLQSEIDEEKERLDKIQHIVVGLSNEKVYELIEAVAKITGLPQRLITDGSCYYVVDYGKYAESGKYRKMQIVASYDSNGKKVKS